MCNRIVALCPKTDPPRQTRSTPPRIQGARHKFAIVRHPFVSRRDGRFRRIPPSLGRIGKQPNEHVLH
jgi:hypothetical protein